MTEIADKMKRLRERLREFGSALVAYSGGVDSTLLSKIAAEELGDRALAVTLVAPFHPAWERKEAEDFARRFGFRHRLVSLPASALEPIWTNAPDRCYHCKTALLRCLRDVAREETISTILEGTTADDADDFRPGRRAVRESGTLSPLAEAGLTKAEIRELSRAAGLPTWDKPSYACLASRFPYGEPITPEKLAQVEKAEDVLRALGLRQCRVRHHGALARIEVEAAMIPRLAGEWRESLLREFRALGFSYVTLDLAGYRTGSLNEVLSESERRIATGGDSA